MFQMLMPSENVGRYFTQGLICVSENIIAIGNTKCSHEKCEQVQKHEDSPSEIIAEMTSRCPVMGAKFPWRVRVHALDLSQDFRGW